MSLDSRLTNQIKKALSPSQNQLLADTQTISKLLAQNHINDYSFLVAPIAKAYEGHLKDFFLKIGLIDQVTYQGDRFRVGKTLNPSLRYKRFSIFQKLADLDQDGEELAESLWTAWKYGRNLIFHYFPKKNQFLTKAEAEERITMILKAIKKAQHFLDKNFASHKYG